LRPASTALNGIAGVACHEGEVFLSHDAGVFSLPLSPPPAHVSPENQAQVAFDRGFPSDFAVAVPTYGVARDADSCVAVAGVAPYTLKLAEEQPPDGALLMSPVLRWREGKKWIVRLPLRKPELCSLIMGLAPEEDCLANAVLLPADARPQRPRVDGILIHQPDPWDDSSHAVRLHELAPKDKGRALWSVGTDLIEHLKEYLGLKEEDHFFLGDVDSGMVLELTGTSLANDRGGITYRLEAAKMRGLQASSSLNVCLMQEPLEAFTMSHSRRVRFYVCTLGAAPARAEGRGDGAETAPAAALEWMPEHLPSLQMLECAA